MSERKESISDKKISRRSLLKWTGALAGAVAVGVGAGYETDQLLRPINTFTQTEILPVVYEEQVYSSIAGETAGGTPVWVYTKAGRIVRITPIVYSENEAKPWTIKAGGKTFTPRKRANIPVFDLACRRGCYAPNRVLYPMKRAGFTPGGQSSVDSRGKGDFVRISWDEALDILTAELNRIKTTYGNGAILCINGGHGQKKTVQERTMPRLLNCFGGSNLMVRNPDSWEGWYWGGEHTWGFDWGSGVMDQLDVLEDTMQNTKLLIHWSEDCLTENFMHGCDNNQWAHWIKELGIERVFITPDLNQGAAKYADKWIPVRPGTDPALAAAIANVWITEGTYQKDYVNTHGYGFDKWNAYVMGAEDGVPKTPEWAEPITGVKAREIRALARKWAATTTSLCILFGGACRGPYSTEWPRMMVLLLTMQGVGKPGVNFFEHVYSAPRDPAFVAFMGNIEAFADTHPPNPVRQSLYQTVLPGGILNPPVKWYGAGAGAPQSEQFVQKTYPMQGYSEAKMIWMDNVSRITNWNCGYKWIDAYKSPKIQFTVAVHPWLENDMLFADLILPETTWLEQNDIGCIGSWSQGKGSKYGNAVSVYMKKCIEPLGEAKNPYDIYVAIAKRLGVEAQYTEGRTTEDWIKRVFDKSTLPKFTTYDDFKNKGYYVYKFPDDWKRNVGLQWFYNKPNIATPSDGLVTPSGKVEFSSQNLAKNFPDDKERPPVPHYIAEGPTHQESLSSARAKSYPLLVEPAHPRYRFHSRENNISWLNEIPAYKIWNKGVCYEAVWINPKDASPRGIKEGDVVRVFNERGGTLAAAHVTERVMPTVIRFPYGGTYRPAEPGKNYQDTAGISNMISPYETISANVSGMAVNGFLAQVEKWAGS